MAQLPTVPEASRADHILFEMTGGHAKAVAILVRHLGLLGAARAGVYLARRQATDSPLKDLPPVEPGDTGEWLSRRQLEPVLILDDFLQQRTGRTPEESAAVLLDLVAEVGGSLLARRFPELERSSWAAAVEGAREQVARRVFARLGNVPEATIRSGADWLEVDVNRCRFNELCRELGRPQLAPLFCAADTRFFEQPGSPVKLVRTGTMAGGASRCDFRFELPEG